MGRDPAERAMALASLARWPDLDRELEGSTGYRRGGGLRVVESATELAEARADVAAHRADGVPVELVDENDARRITPGLSSAVVGGIHCRIDGQADASATVTAFANAARAHGALIDEDAAVTSIVAERGRVVGVGLKDGRRAACDVAIVAAGAWTARLLAPLGARLALEARGLQMLLTNPGRPALVQVIGRVRGQLSLKQLQSGAYLIGGGWPGEVQDESAGRGRVLAESVSGSFTLAAASTLPWNATPSRRPGWGSKLSLRMDCRSSARWPVSRASSLPPVFAATALRFLPSSETSSLGSRWDVIRS